MRGAKTTLAVNLIRKIRPRKRRGDNCEERVSPLIALFFRGPSAFVFSTMNDDFRGAATCPRGLL
jgi:hypothetical protein